MEKKTLQGKFREIVALASRAERHMSNPTVTVRETPGEAATRRLLEAVRQLSPEVRELLEMDV